MDSKQKILFTCLCNAFGDCVTVFPCIAPLICWALWKDDADSQVADYARRRLNAAISWAIWCYGSLLLTAVLVGYISLIVLLVWGIIAIVKDIIRANSGDTSYKFPLTIQFIKPRTAAPLPPTPTAK